MHPARGELLHGFGQFFQSLSITLQIIQRFFDLEYVAVACWLSKLRSKYITALPLGSLEQGGHEHNRLESSGGWRDSVLQRCTVCGVDTPCAPV